MQSFLKVKHSLPLKNLSFEGQYYISDKVKSVFFVYKKKIFIFAGSLFKSLSKKILQWAAIFPFNYC